MKRVFILCFIMFATALFVNAQNIQISGEVTDAQTKQPLSGASVFVSVKDTKVGTVTNPEGIFTLSLPQGTTTFTVSFIGYRSQNITIGAQKVFKVDLAPSSKQLNKLVVTALNIKRSERSIGYSVSTLSGNDVNQVQSINLASALIGKVAGVDISNSATGMAGSKRIVIRGAASLTGDNQPLIVVDGVPLPSSASTGGLNNEEEGIDYGNALNDINPDDIASITVLKSNAAAALYGNRAAHGVILITTKSGANSDGELHLQFSSSLLVDRLYNPTDYQYIYGQESRANSGEVPINADDAFSSGSWGPKMEGQLYTRFDGAKVPFLPVGKDNYNRFFRTGTTLTNTAALSGGNKKTEFRVSISDLRNTDVAPTSSFRRNGINLNTTSHFGNLTAYVSLGYTYEEANNRPALGGSSSNLFYSLIHMPANINIETLKPGYNPDGTEFTYAEGLPNPYWFINKVKENDTKNVFRGNLDLTYHFTKWLYARGKITRYYYQPKRTYIEPAGGVYTSYPQGRLEQRVITDMENRYQFLLGLSTIHLGHFSVNAFMGASTDMRTREEANTSGRVFVVPNVFTYNNLAEKLASTSDSKQKTNSLFGNLEWSYNNYLYLTLTARNDWFSTLPVKSDNLLYPSASLSFVFSDAFKLPSWITYGQFRASAGQVSGDPDPGQLQLSYTLAQVGYNSNPLQYIGTGTIPNADLVPLLSTDYEFGLTMNFLNDRLGFDVDYYNRQVVHDIVYTEVPYSSGYRKAVLNVGKLNSQGVDISLNLTPIKARNFKWDVNATFSYNNNKVIALGPGNPPIILEESSSGDALIELVAGKRYGSIYGYDFLRDSATGKKVYSPAGIPQRSDKPVFLGSGQYNKIIGFRNTFTYKNFSFYFLIDAKFGADIFSESNYMSIEDGQSKATLRGRENGLDVSGISSADGKPITVHIRGIEKDTINTGSTSISGYYKDLMKIDRVNMYNGNFIKLREVSLGYSFPHTFLSHIGISNLTVSIVARNLLNLMDHIPNADPESIISTGNAQGFERMSFPVTREFGLKINLNL